MKRTFFLIFILLFVLGTVASAMTLRLHTPVSTSWSGDESTDTFSSSGLSGRAIFGMLGLGYTTSTLSAKPSSGTSSNYGSKALDVSLTPPVFDIVTVGVGPVIGGSVPENQNLDSASGSTTFLNLNFGLGPLDLLLGYRMWDVVQKRKSGSKNKLIYNEVGLGVGIGF